MSGDHPGLTIRIGHGFDVHRFSDRPDRALVLGGVTITGDDARGLDGHSDADAVAHAVADAVLGAAGLGDLGRYAPDSDPQWHDADSMVILARMVELAHGAGWAPVNADCTVVAERPRLSPFVGIMSERLAAVLGAPANVKATRGEGIGPLGRAEGIGCWAVVLLGPAPGDRGPGLTDGGRGAGRSRGGGRRRGGTGRSRAVRGSGSHGRGSAATQSAAGRPRPPDVRAAGRRSTASGLGGDQVEGRQAVRELLRANRRSVRSLLLADGMEASPILDEIEALAARRRVRVEYVSRRRLDSVARTDGSQGVVALARPIEDVPLDALCARSGRDGVPFLMVLDGITDPHNVGALLRTAECAGVSGVVLPRHRSAHLSPTVAKVAAGAIEYLPIALAAGIPTALQQLSGQGVWTIGMVEEARQSFYDLPLGDQPLAIVLGSEGAGLSALARKRCDVLACLPHHGALSSLNVSTAGAIACFDVARRRGAARQS